MTPYLVLEHVDKCYTEGDTRRTVLASAGTVIERGALVVVQGRSGSGKTTLLNLIGGLDQPDAGVIRAGDQAIQDMDDHARTLFRRRHCGFVFQFFNLVPTLTVRENAMIGPELNGLDGDESQERVHRLLGEVGLPDRGDSFPDQLSGGEQQRVALVRALAHRPGLLLADEPTGNLDAATELEILDLIRRLPREQNTTVVVASHSDLVAGYADRVLSIDSGMLTGS